jgi:two-component system, NarL family, sensor kinase
VLSALRRVRKARPVTAAIIEFALSGLVALVLVGIGGAIVLRDIGIAQATDEARRVTEVAGRGIVEPALSEAAVRGAPQAIEELDRVIRRRVLDPIIRVKVWAPDGRIVYSDEERLVGTTYSVPDDLREALETGTAAAEISDLSGPENRFERGMGRLLEVYMPVRPARTDPLIFEAYIPFDSVAAGGERIWLRFAPALLFALLVLWLLQMPLAWSVARRLRTVMRERERLLRRAIEASDAERRRIAGELHDGVVQDLAGLTFAVDGAINEIHSIAPKGVTENLRRAAARARQTIRQLRTLLVEIYPPNLRTSGLEAALSDLIAPAGARGIDVRLHLPPELELTPAVEELLFRTAQEGLRNVVAHAGASVVDVTVTANGTRTSLVVQDDGRGFHIGEINGADRSDGHFGLRVLADLASDAGGVLEIRSEPGRGTRLRLEVPAE